MMTMYLLPWEPCGTNMTVRREALSKSRYVFARIDQSAGMFIGKTACDSDTDSRYAPSAMSFRRVCYCNTLEEAIGKVDAELLIIGCKFVDKKMLVMI